MLNLVYEGLHNDVEVSVAAVHYVEDTWTAFDERHRIVGYILDVASSEVIKACEG